MARVIRALAILTAVALTGAAVVLVITHALRAPFFEIRRVDVGSGRHLRGEVIAARLDSVARGNIFRVDIDRIAALVKADPWVEGVSVRRSFPDTISVQIREYLPVAVLELGDLYYLDRRGRPFALVSSAGEGNAGGVEAPDTPLPVITGLDGEALKAPASESRSLLQKAMALLSASEGLVAGLRIDRIRIEPDKGAHLVLDGAGFEVLLGKDCSVEQLHRLETLLARAGGHDFKEGIVLDSVKQSSPVRLIDLRFRNMAVLRQNR